VLYKALFGTWAYFVFKSKQCVSFKKLFKMFTQHNVSKKKYKVLDRALGSLI